MKAVQVSHAGGPEVLELVDLPVSRVKSGWSLIEVKGFGVNRSEIFTRQGHSPNVQFPRVLGIECVGVIAETTDSARLPLGQRVLSTMGEMGRAFDGSYAEYVLIPNEQIYPVDTSLSWEEFAAVPETFFTAYGSLKQLQLKAEDTVLVRGASSGVGIAFAKLIKALYPKIELVGSIRNLTKAERLKAIGYDSVIQDREGQLETAKNFSKILELIGPKTIKDSLSHIDPSGIVCSTGLLGGQWYLEDFDPTYDLRQNAYLTTFYSGNVSDVAWQELFEVIERYHVDVRPERIFTLEEIQEAHRYLEGSQAFGKVIISLEGHHD